MPAEMSRHFLRLARGRRGNKSRQFRPHKCAPARRHRCTSRNRSLRGSGTSTRPGCSRGTGCGYLPAARARQHAQVLAGIERHSTGIWGRTEPDVARGAALAHILVPEEGSTGQRAAAVSSGLPNRRAAPELFQSLAVRHCVGLRDVQSAFNARKVHATKEHILDGVCVGSRAPAVDLRAAVAAAAAGLTSAFAMMPRVAGA